MRSDLHLRAAACLLCISCTPNIPPYPFDINIQKSDRWTIYYGHHLTANRFADYNLVVLDRINYPDFRTLHKKTKVLAYINVGEVLNGTPEKMLLAEEGDLFTKQTKKGYWVVDLNSDLWQTMIMDKVDDAVDKGFDGVMIDRIDSPLRAAVKTSLESASNTHSAAVSLIRSIRDKHPHIKIMLNQSLDIFPEVADKIDYLLTEGILTNFNLFTGQSRLNDSNSYQQAASALRWARNLSPTIKIYTLDYWNTTDVDTIKKIYRLQREQGFSPYVTTPDLQHYTPEPK